MSAVASILSIDPVPRVRDRRDTEGRCSTPMVSQSADHLGFTKKAYQRIGAARDRRRRSRLLVGLSAKGSSFWAIVNEVAAARPGRSLMLGAVVVHLRKGRHAQA